MYLAIALILPVWVALIFGTLAFNAFTAKRREQGDMDAQWASMLHDTLKDD
jgi:hypothetical protein